MKTILLCLLLTVVTVANADTCTAWRGQVYQFQTDGSLVLLENQVLYAYDVTTAYPIETFTFGTLITDDVQTISITLPDRGYGWFSGLDSVWPYCQFTLGYNVDNVISAKRVKRPK